MSQFLDSFVLLFGGIALIGGLLKLGGWLGGKRAPWLALVLPVVGVGAAAVAGSSALDRYGTPTQPAVVGKTEWVTLMPNGSFLKNYSVTVKQRGAAVGETVNLRTDRGLFDTLALGDSIAVRSLSWRPSFGRLEAMTGARWLGIVADSGLVLFVVGVVAVLVGVFLYGGTGASGAVRKAMALVLLGGGGFSCWQEARPYRGEPAPELPAGSAHAKVTRIRSVTGIYPVSQSTSSTRGWRLKQRYQIVEAEFTPGGARAPVVGVDAIDAGSIPKLGVGSPVDLDYDRAEPRKIRVKGAARLWPAINARDTWLGLGVIGALIGGLMVLGRLFRRTRGPAKGPAAAPSR